MEVAKKALHKVREAEMKVVCAPLMYVFIFTPRFEGTRGLFWDGPLTFEPRSDEMTTSELALQSPNFRTTPAEGTFDPDRFNTYQTCLQAVHRKNRVSNLEPSEVETLPPIHRGLKSAV
ncbi:hypothetical protein AVEN_182190-1 [Araneus ventricosus]|uniref:Uncharacterized protein n=1 Tax=Araneus ventricosus TaxID=182803 RepID=A0A4Y2E0E6_ARAVE|nr:hypothetical protein AVEN_182190-1 [Araneus ventricosus]